MKAPVSVRGSFIPVASPHDAFVTIGRVLSPASKDLLIIDPYLDATVLSDFVPAAQERVSIKLLADGKKEKPDLRPAARRWSEQYGEKRPLEVRITEPGLLHDRLIIVDGKMVWSLTQSFNHLATRSPASILRVEPEITELKLEFYTGLWDSSKSI
jgi:hypothetical protein